MNLSDSEILNLDSLVLEPFDSARVQPASYDMTLYPELLVPMSSRKGTVVDLRTDDPGDLVTKWTLAPEERYLLHPGEMVLGCTHEVLKVPPWLLARVEGKSTLGRLFLAVHVTAGFIDPGFQGQVTLEIVNHGPWTIALYPGMNIAQVNFAKMSGYVAKPYGSKGLGSHYDGQMGPKAAVGKRGPVNL
jgi:dCTP deaminase